MTFDELQKANSTIQTTDIKGKAYAEVNQRIKAFRMCFPEGEISTEMLSNENGVCVFRARILVRDEQGEYKQLGVGHAYEKESEGFINKTSYIENCETSAVGRALAMCGFGIDTAIRSAEETMNAVRQQEELEKNNEMNVNARVALLELCNNSSKAFVESILKHYEVESINQMTTEQCVEALAKAREFTKQKKQG